MTRGSHPGHYAEPVTAELPELPDLRALDGVLFDLDGVLTPTADVHMHAWQSMFTDLFSSWGIEPPYTEDDYFRYLDGKQRYDGVASLLRSRDVEVPWGDPSDPTTADTVCGIGNRKNEVFARVLRTDGQIETRPVQVAVKNRHLAEVRSGLQEGERLVTGERPARSGPQRFKL